MIWDRWYEPNGEELIYHYCGAEAFVEIIHHRSIWLSASYVMNDAMERSWGYAQFQKAAKILAPETGAEFISQIAAAVDAGDEYAILMLACFSLDADVLSQWRAYGDDGQGFAVGFSPKLIKGPVKQLRVLYDEDAQIRELIGNLRHVYQFEKSKGFKYDDQFRSHVFHLGLDLCAYKNVGFREEKEIRLAHTCGIDRGKKTAVPHGARAMGGERLSDPLKIHFRNAKGVVVPYVIVDYSDSGAVQPIKEVVLGPKNQNAELNIEFFLNTVGVSNVNVRRSMIPYR
jgi:hypothetical protein